MNYLQHSIVALCFSLMACSSSRDELPLEQRKLLEQYQKSSPIPSTLPKEFSDLRYAAEIESIGRDGPSIMHITQVPGYAIKFGAGLLFGSDRGEWGGELIYRDAKHVDHKLLDENVLGIYDSPDGAVVFTGLAHMLTNRGAVYVVKNEDAAAAGRAKLAHRLIGSPKEISQISSGKFLIIIDAYENKNGVDDVPHCFIYEGEVTLTEVSCSVNARPVLIG